MPLGWKKSSLGDSCSIPFCYKQTDDKHLNRFKFLDFDFLDFKILKISKASVVSETDVLFHENNQ